MVRSRGADSAAGSLHRLPHRPCDVPPAGDVPEAPGGEGRQAPSARTPILKYQVTTGLSELTELLNWLNGLPGSSSISLAPDLCLALDANGVTNA